MAQTDAEQKQLHVSFSGNAGPIKGHRNGASKSLVLGSRMLNEDVHAELLQAAALSRAEIKALTEMATEHKLLLIQSKPGPRCVRKATHDELLLVLVVFLKLRVGNCGPWQPLI